MNKFKQIYRKPVRPSSRVCERGLFFIFTQVSSECQRRQKQVDVLIFRAIFVFTRPITHAQFKICRTCALKNRKPQKVASGFSIIPESRGISIPLTVNARGLWGRDWGCTWWTFRRETFVDFAHKAYIVPQNRRTSWIFSLLTCGFLHLEVLDNTG